MGKHAKILGLGTAIPPGTEYEDMVQVVVSWTELRLRDPDVMSPFDFRTLTEAALRNTWGCKK